MKNFLKIFAGLRWIFVAANNLCHPNGWKNFWASNNNISPERKMSPTLLIVKSPQQCFLCTLRNPMDCMRANIPKCFLSIIGHIERDVAWPHSGTSIFSGEISPRSTSRDSPTGQTLFFSWGGGPQTPKKKIRKMRFISWTLVHQHRTHQNVIANNSSSPHSSVWVRMKKILTLEGP